MKRVDVYYEGWGEKWKLGTLAHHERIVMFEYSNEALSQQLELSPLCLPLQKPGFSDFPRHQHQLPGLIADSLPEGWGMLVMDRLLKKSGVSLHTVSPLDRLALLGSQAMGALTFYPANNSLVPRPVKLGLLDLAMQAQLVLKGRDSELLKELMLTGGSPHGARPKALVHYNPESGYMSTQPSTEESSRPWLVKFQAENEHKEVCAIEHGYAQLACECGLDIPKTAYFELSSKLSGFGIERFDVEELMRVPTLTLAGSLDADFRTPELSYLNFLQATTHITKDAREVEKAFARMVFNVLFNNRDDHPKNFSFRLNRQREWKLAPCYDLTYSKGPGGYHQMDVMGEAFNISRKELLAIASAVSLSAAKAKSIIDRQLDVAENLGKMLKQQKIRAATIKDIAVQVTGNINRLK